MGLSGPILEISGLADGGLVERNLECRTISVCDRKGGGISFIYEWRRFAVVALPIK